MKEVVVFIYNFVELEDINASIVFPFEIMEKNVMRNIKVLNACAFRQIERSLCGLRCLLFV